MMFHTHLAFGLLAALLSNYVLTPERALLFFALVLLGSLLPDVDHPDSFLGKRTKIFALLFEHRGFLHSIYAVALAVIFGFIMFGNNSLAWALAIGYFSHLVSDAFSKEGIMFFQPWWRFRIHGWIRTGSFLEVGFCLIIVAADLWIFFIHS
ncbi:MAG: metal-dependent hydrolase [Candidatus Nanoarchaeia archaeon]